MLRHVQSFCRSTAVFELIALADRGLFCSSNDLLDSLNNPTVFCKITGEELNPGADAGILTLSHMHTHTHIHITNLRILSVAIPVGVILHYVIVSASLWWLFHVASIFYTITFPFHARRTLLKHKCIYLIPS